MFAQSQSLEKGIQQFRKERIDFFRSQEDTTEFRYSKFLLIHIIPDTFMDSTYDQKMFVKASKHKIRFSDIFSPIWCNNVYIPTVEGLRYPQLSKNNSNENLWQMSGEGLVYDNGIVETFVPMNSYLHNSSLTGQTEYQRFAEKAVWSIIEETIKNYATIMRSVINGQRVFVLISLLGMKNSVILDQELYRTAKIDRNELLLNPVEIPNILDEGIVEKSIKIQNIDYFLSLGVGFSKETNGYIKEIYG